MLERNSPDGVRPALLQGLFCWVSSSPHGRPLPAARCDATGTMASKRWQQGSAQLGGPFLAEPEQDQIPEQHCQLLLHTANCLAVQRLSAPVPFVSRTQGALTEGTTTTASALEKHSLSTTQQPAILYCHHCFLERLLCHWHLPCCAQCSVCFHMHTP